MRAWWSATVVAVGGAAWLGLCGCATVDRLQAQNRNLAAEKTTCEQELTDERGNNKVLQAKNTALQRELDSKTELLANLREENDHLSDIVALMKANTEGLGDRMNLSPIQIVSQLPAPLDSAIKQFAQQHPSLVSYDPARGTVKWNADLLFDLGSDDVKSSSAEALKGFTELLNSPAASKFEVIVVGHTDDRPISRPETRAKHPTNWHLSAHRSIAVSKYLMKDGYAPQRIGIAGYGEFRPFASGTSEDARAQNRRVEIFFVPMGTLSSGSSMSAKPASPEKTLASPTGGKSVEKKPAKPAPTPSTSRDAETPAARPNP